LDGVKNKCRSCCKKESRDHTRNNRASRNAYRRLLAKNPEFREAKNRKNREYRKANRTKNEARRKLYRAVNSGKLIRLPCESCAEPKSQAHHDDYSKPLDVRWLCASCHGKVHRQYD
jgi:hypothetical protein